VVPAPPAGFVVPAAPVAPAAPDVPALPVVPAAPVDPEREPPAQPAMSIKQAKEAPN
jgi:hypothetical protein